jgi:hypothetical protein
MPVNEADILWVELRPNLSRYPRPALDRPRPRRMLFLHQRLLVCYWPCSDEAGAGRTACGTARTPFTRSDIGTRLRSAILIKIIVMRALLSPTSLPSSRPSSPPTATKPPPRLSEMVTVQCDRVHARWENRTPNGRYRRARFDQKEGEDLPEGGLTAAPPGRIQLSESEASLSRSLCRSVRFYPCANARARAVSVDGYLVEPRARLLRLRIEA